MCWKTLPSDLIVKTNPMIDAYLVYLSDFSISFDIL